MQERFHFLRADTLPLHGLQDWSTDRWIKEITQSSKEEKQILNHFLNGSEDNNASASDIANAVKRKIANALHREEWEILVRYQNKRLGFGHAHKLSKHAYLDDALCATSIFKREFPLGVHPSIFEDERKKWEFAVYHSGLSKADHKDNVAITCLLYSSMVGIVTMGIVFLLYYMVGKTGLWDLEEGTIQDASDPEFSLKLNRRTKERGTVASILSALFFSLTVNASIDAIGRIDPSTSTVFIGMLLGNTFGFVRRRKDENRFFVFREHTFFFSLQVLDNVLGSDEGFREYKWNSLEGMKYGIGSLGTSRYARYLITIVFDMFFTVIFFKLLYSRVVRLAGFSNEVCDLFLPLSLSFSNLTKPTKPGKRVDCKWYVFIFHQFLDLSSICKHDAI